MNINLINQLRAYAENSYNTHYIKPTSLDIPSFQSYPFSDYRYLKVVGKGKFSVVYKAAMIKNESKKFAIKEINIPAMSRAELTDFRYELNTLSQLHHECIYQLVSIYSHSAGDNAKVSIC